MMRIRSLKTHLTTVLLLCILLPSVLLGGTAYWFMYKLVTESRIKDVGLIADIRYEQLRIRLHEDNKRSINLLDTVIASCRFNDKSINTCVQTQLKRFTVSNHAAGLSFHSGIENDLNVGTEAISFEALTSSFQAEQLASLSISKLNGTWFYSLIAADPASGFRLVTTYPAEELQAIFADSPALGQSGETFLANNQGLFITQPRYPSQQGRIEPISAKPMIHCLHHKNGEMLDLDYRNIPVIHGFRSVPEIGGGCIMAHIDQTEAFAPLNRLTISLSVSICLIFFLACLVATLMGRILTKPILQLADMAKALSKGDFTLHAPLSRVTEIAELSHLFNDMASQLNGALSQLKTSEHELETKILERTAELHERHRRYFSVIHTIGEGFWRVDNTGRLLEVNPAYSTLSGYSETELIGMHISDLEAKETPEETAKHIHKETFAKLPYLFGTSPKIQITVHQWV